MNKNQDAYGNGIYDYFKTKNGYEIVERDDGFFGVSNGPKVYFLQYNEWPAHERKAIKYARGKVLDIGCGAGRHSLYLQEKGFYVLGIDISPLAIKVCKLRGLKNAKIMSITQIPTRLCRDKLGVFDTILMLGNNFGLFGNFKRARWLLQKFYKLTSEKGRIITESNDIYNTNLPEHLEYHEFNKKRGRMSGQARLRIRYKKYVTPWFDYFMVSKEEMQNIIDGTGWIIKKFINSDTTPYIAIIDKK